LRVEALSKLTLWPTASVVEEDACECCPKSHNRGVRSGDKKDGARLLLNLPSTCFKGSVIVVDCVRINRTATRLCTKLPNWAVL
jgi:hypothetical protein